MTVSEYMVSSEYGNHGVKKKKKRHTLDCVKKTLRECIVVICFTRCIKV